MNSIKKIYDHYAQDPMIRKKLITVLLAVIGMGIFVSILIEAAYGTDPCTFMNLSLSTKLQLSYGTWSVLINIALLLIVFFSDPEKIGPGTLFNMVLIGYISDFCRYIWGKILPADFFTNPATRIPVFLFGLLCFIFCAAVYMNADMGVAPYDALPLIAQKRFCPKFPFRFFRMAYDFLAILIGCLSGGRPGIGIILMALLLGSAITMVGKRMHSLG